MLKFKNDATAGAPIRYDINDGLGLGRDKPSHVHTEVKYSALDGVIIDISEPAGLARRNIRGSLHSEFAAFAKSDSQPLKL